jgi:hypothetical protein
MLPKFVTRQTVAASFLMGYRHALEAGWSSSLYDAVGFDQIMRDLKSEVRSHL